MIDRRADLEKDREFDEVLRRNIGEILGENIDENIDADDLMFDMDGTLFCESDPTWFDFMLYEYRILEDPEHRSKG